VWGSVIDSMVGSFAAGRLAVSPTLRAKVAPGHEATA
jgi:hypothetical protein